MSGPWITWGYRGRNMKHLKLVTGVFLIFFLGALVGAFGARFYVKKKIENLRKLPVGRTHRVMEKLGKRLDLSPEQKQRIEVIVKEMQIEGRSRFLAHRKEMRELFKEGIDQIKKELNATQQKKLDKLIERFEKRRRRIRPPDFPPPGRPHFPGEKTLPFPRE